MNLATHSFRDINRCKGFKRGRKDLKGLALYVRCVRCSFLGFDSNADILFSMLDVMLWELFDFHSVDIKQCLLCFKYGVFFVLIGFSLASDLWVTFSDNGHLHAAIKVMKKGRITKSHFPVIRQAENNGGRKATYDDIVCLATALFLGRHGFLFL